MVDRAVTAPISLSSRTQRSTVIAIITVVTSTVAMAVFIWFAFVDTAFYPQVLPYVAHSQYPVGLSDHAEPSGMAPPGANALKGYTLTYRTNFTGHSLPSGWDVFTGIPGGDPGGHFGAAHVVVRGDLLRLNAWKDPAFGNTWVTGGVCQCGVAQTYGAYFVRSRITKAGPNEVELLWPSSNEWPPEVDFSETASANLTTSTVHYGVTNHVDQRQLSINMTRWHTWGVIWTPSSITYVVNGQVWGTVAVRSEIPNVPMTLDLEQRAVCAQDRQCPTGPTSMLVNWVAEYSPKK